MIIMATAPIAGIEGSRQGSISAPAGPIALANGLNVTAGLAIDDAPCCDLVIVTGGPAGPCRRRRPRTYGRVHASHRIASVCTGGMILAASGVLNDGPATTKHGVARKPRRLEVMR
jgi:transcriptional regulator GlxA family with amidase domain